MPLWNRVSLIFRKIHLGDISSEIVFLFNSSLWYLYLVSVYLFIQFFYKIRNIYIRITCKNIFKSWALNSNSALLTSIYDIIHILYISEDYLSSVKIDTRDLHGKRVRSVINFRAVKHNSHIAVNSHNDANCDHTDSIILVCGRSSVNAFAADITILSDQWTMWCLYRIIPSK